MIKYDALEIARIIGEPVDPRRRYPNLVNAFADTDTADPNEYVYYYDVLLETDKIFTNSASGLTTTNVVPDDPVLLTFTDIATDEYYVKINDLINAKERTLARKKLTINRAMDAEENYQMILLMDAAAISRGNLSDLRSGERSFNFSHLIDMVDQVIDYSEDYSMAVGTQIDKDIKLWDWTDNKYHSTVEAFNDLGISLNRINEVVTRNSVQTTVLSAYVAYLGGKTTQIGKPILFVRKRMNEIERLGGVISESGDRSERLVFVSPNPVQVSTTRYLAVALTGFEQFAAVTKNAYAFAKFTRTV